MKAGVRTTEVRWNGYDHGFCLSLENEHMDPNQSPLCRDFDWSESVATNCAVYIDAFCFSPSSFSLFSYVFN